MNKINILLKALMIERNKNIENDIKIQVIKKEYVSKVQHIASMIGENEELIDKVAQNEITIDKKTEDM